MVNLALVLFASSAVVAAAPPLRLVEPAKAFAVPMFQAPAGMVRTVGRGPVLPRPSFVCHIIVIPADPGIDPKMVVEVPATIDPKIVRRSPCAEPKD